MVGRVLLETLKSVADSPHDVASVLWILYNMSESLDAAIRNELMDHIPHIAMLCHSEKEKLLYVVDHLLPFVGKLLTDLDPQVRKAAQVTLLVLMDQSLVGQSAVEENICPIVNMLSGSDQHPGNAVQLMSKMAPFLGREATERLFLSRFCDTCQDSDKHVRQTCAAYFGEFCAVVGQSTTEEILLCKFVDLCQDKVAFVRKACAEVMMSVSCACTLQRRKTVLAPLFVTLLWDSVSWVRSSAFIFLGPFISTFAVPSVADLVYNENGELVLVNREGCEFRLNPNSERGETDLEEGSFIWAKKPRRVLPNHHHSRAFRKALEDEGWYSLDEKGKDDFRNDETLLEPNRSIVRDDLGERRETNCRNDQGNNFRKRSHGGMVTNMLHAEFNSEEMEAVSESSSDCTTLETDLDDLGHGEGDDINKCSQEEDSSCSGVPSESDFNSFQYWRVPIAEIPNIDQLAETELSNLSVGCHIGNLTKECDKEMNGELPDAGSSDQEDVSDVKISEPAKKGSSAQAQDVVPQELVELFVSMINPPHAHVTDMDKSLHCAFSLPAVALTLGRENWGYLRATYEALAADVQWKVRRTVACSIHELAEILGEELTARDLVPIYTGLIKDLDEVRIGALKHLSDFVKLLPTGERKFFLNQFEMFLVTDNEWNWRFREELAHQLLCIIPLYTPEETCIHLVPVAIALLRDKVAAVRTSALALVTGLIDHVTSEGPLLRKLLPQLAQEFANSTRWERRQAFALLCSHLVTGRVLCGDQFAREILPYLLDLSYDRVPNVRLAVAKTLASDLMAHQFFGSAPSPHQDVLMQVLKRLVNDKDRDVRFFADPRRGSPSQLPSSPNEIPQSPSY